ncbi:hypothetical protein H696_03979 [Fonticula alba]|uniref:C2 domain-containing protein n=1 Tax=Fonticula alba TaxID=691883 RepID=A0A058Z7S2_FONAL|nr:hypothetical protein H696_03979 [Fonticula alba]KCV69557.1 hypothetical protein H696_03979 [Fonticula alba]|eukprot:XP_009496122.1 hypothetical protein H696_03979 [Fonticula alba]
MSAYGVVGTSLPLVPEPVSGDALEAQWQAAMRFVLEAMSSFGELLMNYLGSLGVTDYLTEKYLKSRSAPNFGRPTDRASVDISVTKTTTAMVSMMFLLVYLSTVMGLSPLLPLFACVVSVLAAVHRNRLRTKVKQDIIRAGGVPDGMSEALCQTIRESLTANDEGDGWESPAMIDAMLTQITSFIGPRMAPMIMETAGPMIASSSPVSQILLELVDISLGTASPKILRIRAHRDAPPGILKLDVAIAYAGKNGASAQLRVKLGRFGGITIPVLVHDFYFRATLHVALRLRASYPLMEDITIHCLDEPLVDFSVRPLGGTLDMMALPGVSALVRSHIRDGVRSRLMVPNKVVLPVRSWAVCTAAIPLAPPEPRQMYRPCVGIVRVELVAAAGIPRRDNLAGAGHPFFRMRLHGRRYPEFVSSVRRRATAAQWNESVLFPLTDTPNETDLHALVRVRTRVAPRLGRKAIVLRLFFAHAMLKEELIAETRVPMGPVISNPDHFRHERTVIVRMGATTVSFRMQYLPVATGMRSAALLSSLAPRAVFNRSIVCPGDPVRICGPGILYMQIIRAEGLSSFSVPHAKIRVEATIGSRPVYMTEPRQDAQWREALDLLVVPDATSLSTQQSWVSLSPVGAETAVDEAGGNYDPAGGDPYAALQGSTRMAGDAEGGTGPGGATPGVSAGTPDGTSTLLRLALVTEETNTPLGVVVLPLEALRFSAGEPTVCEDLFRQFCRMHRQTVSRRWESAAAAAGLDLNHLERPLGRTQMQILREGLTCSCTRVGAGCATLRAMNENATGIVGPGGGDPMAAGLPAPVNATGIVGPGGGDPMAAGLPAPVVRDGHPPDDGSLAARQSILGSTTRPLRLAPALVNSAWMEGRQGANTVIPRLVLVLRFQPLGMMSLIRAAGSNGVGAEKPVLRSEAAAARGTAAGYSAVQGPGVDPMATVRPASLGRTQSSTGRRVNQQVTDFVGSPRRGLSDRFPAAGRQRRHISKVLEASSNDIDVIQVTVHSARHLTAADSSGLADPYVHLHLTTGGLAVDEAGKRLPRIDVDRRTNVAEKTLNPVWEQTFNFPITRRQAGYLDSLAREQAGVLAAATGDLSSGADTDNMMAGLEATLEITVRHAGLSRRRSDRLGVLRLDLSRIYDPIYNCWFRLEGVPRGEIRLTVTSNRNIARARGADGPVAVPTVVSRLGHPCDDLVASTLRDKDLHPECIVGSTWDEADGVTVGSPAPSPPPRVRASPGKAPASVVKRTPAGSPVAGAAPSPVPRVRIQVDPPTPPGRGVADRSAASSGAAPTATAATTTTASMAAAAQPSPMTLLRHRFPPAVTPGGTLLPDASFSQLDLHSSAAGPSPAPAPAPAPVPVVTVTKSTVQPADSPVLVAKLSPPPVAATTHADVVVITDASDSELEPEPPGRSPGPGPSPLREEWRQSVASPGGTLLPGAAAAPPPAGDWAAGSASVHLVRESPPPGSPAGTEVWTVRAGAGGPPGAAAEADSPMRHLAPAPGPELSPLLGRRAAREWTVAVSRPGAAAGSLPAVESADVIFIDAPARKADAGPTPWRQTAGLPPTPSPSPPASPPAGAAAIGRPAGGPAPAPVAHPAIVSSVPSSAASSPPLPVAAASSGAASSGSSSSAASPSPTVALMPGPGVPRRPVAAGQSTLMPEARAIWPGPMPAGQTPGGGPSLGERRNVAIRPIRPPMRTPPPEAVFLTGQLDGNTWTAAPSHVPEDIATDAVLVATTLGTRTALGRFNHVNDFIGEESTAWPPGSATGQAASARHEVRIPTDEAAFAEISTLNPELGAAAPETGPVDGPGPGPDAMQPPGCRPTGGRPIFGPDGQAVTAVTTTISPAGIFENRSVYIPPDGPCMIARPGYTEKGASPRPRASAPGAPVQAAGGRPADPAPEPPRPEVAPSRGPGSPPALSAALWQEEVVAGGRPAASRARRWAASFRRRLSSSSASSSAGSSAGSSASRAPSVASTSRSGLLSSSSLLGRGPGDAGQAR